MAFTKSDFELSNLSSLNSADVSQLLDQLSTQLQELNPNLDLKRGVFKDTVAYYHAVLEAAIRTNLERYQSARSLQQIQADPTLADAGVVDQVLSNFNVTRRVGTKATGTVTIEISQSASVTVPANAVFEGLGKQYLATKTFIARTTASQVSSDSDRLITALSNGNYAFTIEVEATEIGSDSKLNAGDLIVPNRTLANYVTSFATSTFTDGTSTETNAELLADLQLGMSAKTISNRSNMKAWVKSNTAYSSVTNQSLVGYGDAEMLRDQHTIFPISYGGRVDWYIRGQAALQVTSQVAEATLVSVSGSTSLWRFSLDKDVFPGLYEIRKVRREVDSALDTGFEIVSDTRSNDLTASGFLPDIKTVAEGAYSSFQTVTIEFTDTVTATSGLTPGDKANYAFEITGVPHIKAIQSDASNRDYRSYAADALIKAPVPCFVDINLTLNKSQGDSDPNTDGIKSSIVEEVNSVGFIGRLDGSRLIEKINAFLQDDISVTDLDFLGRIRRPDGSIKYLRSGDALVVPEEPDKMVGSKTVQFFAEVSSIAVNVKTSIPTPS